MYQPAWAKLKSDYALTIAAHPNLHGRIFKAITKEKDLDIAYKYELSEKKKTAKLHRKTSGWQLHITLNVSIGLEDLI